MGWWNHYIYGWLATHKTAFYFASQYLNSIIFLPVSWMGQNTILLYFRKVCFIFHVDYENSQVLRNLLTEFKFTDYDHYTWGLLKVSCVKLQFTLYFQGGKWDLSNWEKNVEYLQHYSTDFSKFFITLFHCLIILTLVINDLENVGQG